MNIPRPSVLWLNFHTPLQYAVLSFTLALCVALLTRKWMLSPWGRLLKAVRDDRVVVAGLGKDPGRVEQKAFAISCALGAVAGVLYAGYASFVEPSAASLDHSILMLSMVLIGGAGTFQGAITGAAILILFPEVLRLVDIPGPLAANVRLLVYGCLLIVLVHFRPQGIAGEYRVE
jgi:branched-chain amino acid transport system permease protein